MRTYSQYCPIARGSEIFATRWTPIIVRNMLIGCETFGEILAGAPGMPRSLLSERLRQLERHGLVIKRGTGRNVTYRLTDAGRDLGGVIVALGDWGLKWLELSHEHLDPYFLLWSLSRDVISRGLPDERLTIRFDFDGVRKAEERFWLVVHPPEPEICAKHPGFDEDLFIRAHPRDLAQWRLGKVTLQAAMREGSIQVEGPRSALRVLTTCLGSSHHEPQPA